MNGIRSTRVCVLLGLIGGAASPRAAGEVVRVEILRREPFADAHPFEGVGAYEKLAGRLHFAVDPHHPANRSVVDIELAPRTPEGKVSFESDFYLLRPMDPAKGNRRLLYDVNNRGDKLAIAAFNGARSNDPSTRGDAGNGFLMRQGYTILWTGWNGDVLPGNNRLQIELPIATEAGRAITGKIYSEICVSERVVSQPLCWGNTRVYPAVTLDQGAAVLTARVSRAAPAQEVVRDEWSFARWADGRVIPDAAWLYLREGFRPGWLYELVYTSRDPRVSGLGLVGIRDAVSFFRYERRDAGDRGNPIFAAIDRAYVFGISQSGRVIHDFLFQGFNSDEDDRMVFDAALSHVAGAGRTAVNSRFAQITRHPSPHEEQLYPIDTFPFGTARQRDPLSGEEGDWLQRARDAGHVPKLFITSTSTEYWGRGVSLLHTDVEGREDVRLDPNVRLYHIAGGQHLFFTPQKLPCGRHPVNTLNYQPLLRSLLVALDRWVTTGEEPPESRYPRIADGTLVDVAAYRRTFPAIPGVDVPESCYAPLRLDPGPRWKSHGIADHLPPRVGPAYRTLVPAVDADGNERAGIRLPDVRVPLGTFVGWNLRSEACGAGAMLTRWEGSCWMLAADGAAREAAGDPRWSVLERYPTRTAYVSRVREAVVELGRQRLVLDEDTDAMLRSAAGHAFWPDDDRRD